MKNSFDKLLVLTYSCFLIFVISIPIMGYTQCEDEKVLTQDSLITIARQIINATPYCALITIDEDGKLHARAMEPFPPEENMVIWFGTNPKSKKVKHIQNNSQVLLYYFESKETDYVTILGSAQLVNDLELKVQYWKENWEKYYPNREDAYLLIKVIPKSINVFSFKHGAVGDPETWYTPSVDFDIQDSED